MTSNFSIYISGENTRHKEKLLTFKGRGENNKKTENIRGKKIDIQNNPGKKQFLFLFKIKGLRGDGDEEM